MEHVVLPVIAPRGARSPEAFDVIEKRQTVEKRINSGQECVGYVRVRRAAADIARLELRKARDAGGSQAGQEQIIARLVAVLRAASQMAKDQVRRQRQQRR